MGTWPFQHVVFDTIDTMRQVLRDRLSDEVGKDIVDYGKEGKGYDMLTRRCLMYFHTVTHKLKAGWTVVGHLKYRSVKDEDGDDVQLWAPAVNPGLSDGVAQLADLLLEIRRVSVVTRDKNNKKKYHRQFVLETITPPENEWTTHELGTRVPMNATLEIPKDKGIVVLSDAYNTAVEQERENWE